MGKKRQRPSIEKSNAPNQSHLEPGARQSLPPPPEEPQVQMPEQADPADTRSYHNLDVTTLPSRGVPYAGTTHIPIRIWTVDEVELVSVVRGTAGILDNALMDALAKAIKFPVGEITHGDLVYLYVWQRVNAYGWEYPIKHHCDETNRQVTNIFDLRTLQQVHLTERYDSWVSEKGSRVTLDKEEPVVVIETDLVRAKHYRERARYLAQAGHEDVSENIALLGAAIKSINGKPYGVARNIQLLRALKPISVKKLEAVHDLFYHGLNFDRMDEQTFAVKVQCTKWKGSDKTKCQYCIATETGEGSGVVGIRSLRLPFQFDLIVPSGSQLFNLEDEI